MSDADPAVGANWSDGCCKGRPLIICQNADGCATDGQPVESRITLLTFCVASGRLCCTYVLEEKCGIQTCDTLYTKVNIGR